MPYQASPPHHCLEYTHTNFLTYKYVRGRKYEEKKFCVFGLGYCNAV